MAHAKNHDFHILPPSVFPFYGAVSAFLMLFGAVAWIGGGFTTFFGTVDLPGGPWLFLIGLVGVLYVMFGWWKEVVAEGNGGVDHTPVVRIGLRYGFILFILSEIMFFVAWFWMFFEGALFHELRAGGGWDGVAIGVDYAAWAHGMPGVETFDPWHLPLMNTLILLLSGTTVTWAHHALQHGDRKGAIQGLILTVLLGLSFTGVQIYEYSHAHFGFDGNLYGATFFMATGFHGAHVAIGTIFLAVCLFRLLGGGMTPKKHFGLEAAAWYWHFVDVVWIFLFAFVYVTFQGIGAH